MFNIFGTPPAKIPEAAPAQQQAAPTNVPANPGNIPNQDPAANPTLQTPAAAPNGVVPDAAATKPPEEGSLESFSTLWETTPNKEGDPNTPAAPAELNIADVQKVMAKTDFSNQISPENLAAITAGGEEASAALPAILNAVAQQVMVQSTMVNNKLAEKSIKEAITTHMATIPGLVRKQTSSNHLVNTNPLFNDPAIKPVIEATQTQLLQKFPNATPDQITKMTQDYVTAMGEAFNPKPNVNDNAGSGTDWEAFLQTP